jgi:hypothetical protein
MTRRKKVSTRNKRVKINLTIHPDIQTWAKTLAHRRTVSQLFEDLVEAEWYRRQNPPQLLQHQAPELSSEILANHRYRQPVQQQQ